MGRTWVSLFFLCGALGAAGCEKIVGITDDLCPDDPLKAAPGICGCGKPDVDSDEDGTFDCDDWCPGDRSKVDPGVCGCGKPDVIADGDGDGVADCVDLCPADPKKTAPGICDCGKPDVDTDGDMLKDCQDDCPHDASRSAAGLCGCGVPDDRRLCLAHWYTFDDSPGSTVITDSVGHAPGETVNQPVVKGGAVTLEGGQYVTLPAGIISSLGDEVTIELWVSWKGTAPWERVFDFGNSVAPKGGGGGLFVGSSYFFLSPSGGPLGVLRAAVSDGGFDHDKVADGPMSLPNDGTLRHVAVSVSRSHDTITLYVDGALVATGLLKKMRLSLLEDVNNWLGRSQYAADPPFEGSIAELRIYSAARTEEQMRASAAAGPDALPAQ